MQTSDLGKRTAARAAAAVLVAASAVVTLAPAHASPVPGIRVGSEVVVKPGKPYPSQAEVDRARAEVDARAAQLDQIAAVQADADRRIGEAYDAAEMAAERFNAAHDEAARARREAAGAVRAARRTRVAVENQRLGIALLAAQNYEDGTALDSITTFMGTGGPMSVMQRYGVAQSAGQAMKLRYDDYARLSKAADRAEARATRAQARAARLASESRVARQLAAFATQGPERARATASSVSATLHADYATAKKKLDDLVRDRKDALRRLKDKNPANDPGPERALPPAPKPEKKPAIVHGIAASTAKVIPRTYPGPVADPPKVDKAAANKAIRFAMDQLGDPYLWAATGPDRWDCSGLTMGAWGAAGVSLPHYSEAQYLTSTPISAADLAPGDLVFWQGRQEHIHHVAMYIGNGEIIHAPRTGDHVRIVKLEDFVPPDFFARPHSKPEHSKH